MNKTVLVLVGVFVLLLFIVGIPACSSYNSMVKKEEALKGQWSNVENVYQRRLDLIPNLVEVVKGYAKHEKQTLVEVIEARAKATDVNIDAGELTPEKMQQFQAAQGSLTEALSKLMVVVEQYPELKANENFRDLQAQLEGTENRIAVERRKFNQTVQEFNTYVRSFPAVLFAKLFGFSADKYFEMDEGADKAPEIDFDEDSDAGQPKEPKAEDLKGDTEEAQENSKEPQETPATDESSTENPE